MLLTLCHVFFHLPPASSQNYAPWGLKKLISVAFLQHRIEMKKESSKNMWERKSLIKCFRTTRQSRNNQPRRQQWARQGSSPGKQQRVRVGSVAVNRFVEVPCWIEFTISRQKCTYKVHLARDITQMRCGRSLDIAVKISSQHDFDKLLLWLVIVVFFYEKFSRFYLLAY